MEALSTNTERLGPASSGGALSFLTSGQIVSVPVKEFSHYFRTKVLPALPVLGPEDVQQFRAYFYSMLASGGIDRAHLSEPRIESLLSS